MKLNRIIIFVICLVLILLISVFIYKTKTKNLIFSVSSVRVKCITPKLYVYDGNTYKFKNKIGNYKYKVSNILDNIENTEENGTIAFQLTDSKGNIYSVYDSNKEFMNFINEINISLDVCEN